jgi:pSer/pThr/pTyr-binding forkhead associated (FHA) protein
MITDLDSSNGTFVDGTPIYSPTKLVDKCRINIGEYVMSFQELDDPVFEPPETLFQTTTRTLFIEDEDGGSTSQDVPWSMESLAEDAPPPETIIEDTLRVTDTREPSWMPDDLKTEPPPATTPVEEVETPIQEPSLEQELQEEPPEEPEEEPEEEPQQVEAQQAETAPEIVETIEEMPAPAQEPPTNYWQSQAPPIPTAPQEAKTIAESAISSQEAYTELLRSIQTAHLMGQSLRDRWLTVLDSIEASITQFQTIYQEMAALESQAGEAKLDELFSKLSNNPNDVKVLVELADLSNLIEKIVSDYLTQADKIGKVKDDLESILKN